MQLTGKYTVIIKLVNLPLLDDDKGINQSGTFHIICSECDNKIFSDYEEPKNYRDLPTSKMIAQIAMKNYLKSIAKRKLEMAIYVAYSRKNFLREGWGIEGKRKSCFNGRNQPFL